MRRLTESDVARMADAGGMSFDAENLKKSVKKSLKINNLPPAGAALSDRPALIDCHGKREGQAFDEIDSEIKRIRDVLELKNGANNELIIITGKSGIIKKNFHNYITIGPMQGQIKSWKLLNDGCYLIRIKAPI